MSHVFKVEHVDIVKSHVSPLKNEVRIFSNVILKSMTIKNFEYVPLYKGHGLGNLEGSFHLFKT
jgi:hypothetical protein